MGYQTRSQAHITLTIPRINSEKGKSAFSFYAPDKWNKLQISLKMDSLVSVETFKVLLNDTLRKDCSCFV